MTNETKRRMYASLTTAAEFIRSHVESGLFPEDVDEEDEKGLEEYRKSCYRAEKMILTLSKKYQS